MKSKMAAGGLRIPRVVLAGNHSGVGKTTISMGIMAALQKGGYTVQPFKVGPDYIDPSYHSQVCGRPCHNLDSWLLTAETILEIFSRRAQASDLAIIEGVMGLFDGVDGLQDAGSTAHIAKILAAPVILILDCKSMSRSAAAVAYGYARLDPGFNLAGVIANKVGSAGHYQMVKEAIENLAGIPVLGYLPREEELVLPERHLGLIPTDEKALLAPFIDKLSRTIEQFINLEEVLAIARQAPDVPTFSPKLYRECPGESKVILAVAQDNAFNFYYPENLDLLRYYGAEIVPFSPLADPGLPADTSGLYIGGGFPELFGAELEGNYKIRKAIKEAIAAGVPVYAECGGLMYMMEEIVEPSGKSYGMVGVIPGKAVMQNRRIALGYVEVEVVEDNILSRKGDRYRGHEFHWSALEGTDPALTLCYQISKSLNKSSKRDGFKVHNLLASYTHLHFASYPELARNFVRAMAEYQAKKNC